MSETTGFPGPDPPSETTGRDVAIIFFSVEDFSQEERVFSVEVETEKDVVESALDDMTTIEIFPRIKVT